MCEIVVQHHPKTLCMAAHLDTQITALPATISVYLASCGLLQLTEVKVLPPVAAAQGPLVAVSLGDGIVGLFESKMPFKEPDLLPLHAMSRPLAVLAMIVVGGWQFVRTK